MRAADHGQTHLNGAVRGAHSATDVIAQAKDMAMQALRRLWALAAAPTWRCRCRQLRDRVSPWAHQTREASGSLASGRLAPFDSTGDFVGDSTIKEITPSGTEGSAP